MRAVAVLLGLVSAAAGVLLLGNRRVVVRGVSMRPALGEGERVLVDRLAYRLGRPRRGEVVLVRGRPGDGPQLLLKRLIGLPGETVLLARDRLHVDGVALDLGRPVVGSSPGTWPLGPDEYFVLSENLAIGTDSRHTGPVRGADLLGRAWLVYAPALRRLGRGYAVGQDGQDEQEGYAVGQDGQDGQDWNVIPLTPVHPVHPVSCVHLVRVRLSDAQTRSTWNAAAAVTPPNR